ncbi:nucleoside diphosphate kinase 2, chloroplastic [Nicotiana tabacum]|uniref:Nucleoside diphosphate kinase 2, chloroplastic n=2 Tax=Nicotiana tabacum TaxID=4097 RepID=NDK2_TOBAC|nr:nucleoside diphosphate kinase 2, chloroplastic [Nicotiana tabacum]XP_016442628.1 PREDICTED: nucleoside diphosphate kinase 2, chloroplastic [Nicotiana tabacum]Q852S5.1 RecName: Full=Nucleoside diphosphate kinase 2, chloroplastic; AltName: Full=Nucleoside diphosphate kinase II; Short=NDK II; Short=NDP kinase II; Short=NDPK II; Flags: Precursor [Nicotiana tabacum]BAC55280.1 nucleoside diphosphate kinase [Nicotiana tabacum]
MGCLSVVGASPCVSSSALSSPTSRLSCAPSCKLILNPIKKNHHLAAFQPAVHLFASNQSRSHASKRNHTTRIFLPHLVASMEEVEETYIMIKPDGVQRGLVGEIISRFEKKGFKLTGLKLFHCPKELAEEHYKDLQSKPFFPKLIDYITSGPVVCMAWEGVGVVASARKLIGATNPLNAEPGTIRGDLAVQTGRNVVHGSDSPDNGKREIALWFGEGELCSWTPVQEPWLIE